jgi:hypothetical protein
MQRPISSIESDANSGLGSSLSCTPLLTSSAGHLCIRRSRYISTFFKLRCSTISISLPLIHFHSGLGVVGAERRLIMSPKTVSGASPHRTGASVFPTNITTDFPNGKQYSVYRAYRIRVTIYLLRFRVLSVMNVKNTVVTPYSLVL